MTAQEVKRKLAAILSADVKGDRRLIGGGEAWSIRVLNENAGTTFDHLERIEF